MSKSEVDRSRVYNRFRESDREVNQLNRAVEVFSFLSRVTITRDFDQLPGVIDLIHDPDIFVALEAESVLKELVHYITDEYEREYIEDELDRFSKRVLYLMEKLGMVEVRPLPKKHF
ncbi:MAG: hypothetical protein ACXAEU_10990 [Candidatus Hodarchaeales archaeon]|jgi:hypothetical protein